jgi:hypothetical protein
MRILTTIRLGSAVASNPAPIAALAGEIQSDLSLSVYDTGYAAPFQAKTRHRFQGGKWTGLYDYFLQNPGDIDAYDLFWFPDDDIEADAQAVNRFLSIVCQEQFELAQPALTPDSYFNHLITLAHPSFAFRRTNFVELMMPIMTRRMLLKLLPIFKDRHAALGIDLFWHQLASRPDQNVAIVDAAPLRHGRRGQVLLKSAMREQSIDIDAEKRETMGVLSVRAPLQVVRAARTKTNTELTRGPALWWNVARDLQQAKGRMTAQKATMLEWIGLAAGQILGRPDRLAFDPAKLKD